MKEIIINMEKNNYKELKELSNDREIWKSSIKCGSIKRRRQVKNTLTQVRIN